MKPYNQKVEADSTKTEFAPSTRREVKTNEKVIIQPFIQGFVQHTTKKECSTKVKKEIKDISKKVIQPINKDNIQQNHYNQLKDDENRMLE